MLDGRTAVSHILSGRGVDAELERIEKLRIAMEERPDERNVARYTRAEELFRTNGGYAADSEARALAAGLGIGPSRIDHPDRRAVRWRAAARRAGAHPVRRQRRAVPRRADEPPRRRRQGVADGVPAGLPRGAARHQPRPRAARRGDHARAPPRPPGRGRRRPPRRVQGHVHAVPRGAGRRRGAPHQDGGPPGQGDRPTATLRRPLRRQGHQGGGGPQHGEADRPPGGRQGRGDPRRQGAARQVPAAADARSHGRWRSPG